MSATRQVGEFIRPRATIRVPKNPMDQATIVSIFPRDLDDVKETIYPGKFHIPAGSMKDPSITVIGSSSWFKDTDVDQPITEIPVAATTVAHSIIVDYCNGMLGWDMDTSMPGLFFIPGVFTQKDILDKYKVQLALSKNKQDNWYRFLVNMADALWARMNGNPLAIWDLMRLAATELGIDKPWLKNYQVMEMVKCFACGALRNPEYPVCQMCKVVDPNHPLAKDLQFAR